MGIKLETPAFPISVIAKGGFGQGMDLKGHMSLSFSLEPKYFDGSEEKLRFMVLGSFKQDLTITELSIKELPGEVKVRCIMILEGETN